MNKHIVPQSKPPSHNNRRCQATTATGTQCTRDVWGGLSTLVCTQHLQMFTWMRRGRDLGDPDLLDAINAEERHRYRHEERKRRKYGPDHMAEIVSFPLGAAS